MGTGVILLVVWGGGENPEIDQQPVQRRVAILLGMLHANVR